MTTEFMPRPKTRPDGWPTRNDVSLFSPAEHAIHAAMEAVERTGGSLALTDAVQLLQKARDRVADHVEGQGDLPAMPKGPAGDHDQIGWLGDEGFP